MSTQRLASHIGQACRIALPSYPGSGAAWYVDSPSVPVRVTLEEELPGTGPDKAGRQVFVVVGELPGDYELRFVLKRAWENEVRNSRRVVLQVRQANRRGRAH